MGGGSKKGMQFSLFQIQVSCQGCQNERAESTVSQPSLVSVTDLYISLASQDLHYFEISREEHPAEKLTALMTLSLSASDFILKCFT